VLALDVGTSSLRTALFDLRARLVPGSMAQRSYALGESAPAMAELAPRTLAEAARQCLAETLAWRDGDRSLAAVPIRAVGASCFWHSMLGVDDRGRALTPIYTWADGRCAADAERLRGRLDERRVHAETGCMLRASFWPARLVWLRRTRPDLWRRVRHWLSPGEWLYWRLAGIKACATGMATGTGLYDPSRLEWHEGLLDACGLSSSQLPAVQDAPQRMSPHHARRLPALAHAAWNPAIGDGAAGNLGSGATRPGTAAINYGTSAAIRVLRAGARATAPFGLFAYRVDSRRYLVGGAVSNAGNLRAWCLRELRVPDDPAAVERLLTRRPGPDHGLTILPFWTAERAPTWRDDLAGCIQGLRQSTTALDIVQALTEATFHRLADIAARVPRAGHARLIVSGGLARSPSGLRRLASVLGHSIWPSREVEASLRGAAVRAIECLGLEPPAAPTGKRVDPDPVLARRYASARRRQRALERAIHD
jgi:gluconokinase